jgi:hypothetical protein
MSADTSPARPDCAIVSAAIVAATSTSKIRQFTVLVTNISILSALVLKTGENGELPRSSQTGRTILCQNLRANLLQVVGLDFQTHEFSSWTRIDVKACLITLFEFINMAMKQTVHSLKLPILMIQKMRVSTLKHHLLPVVLCHGTVALVDGQNSVRSNFNDVVVEWHCTFVIHRIRLPHVNAWWQQDWLTIVHGISDEALFHDANCAIAVRHTTTDRARPYASREAAAYAVHTRFCEQVRIALIHQ